MRIFVAGATGVIGRELLPLLGGHDVTGMTRSRPELVAGLGAEPVVCDAYDRAGLFATVAAARPEVVVDLLTDLAERDFAANARMRREGTRNLVDAAVEAGARRLVVESVDLELSPDGAAAVAEMERHAEAAPLETVVLRFPLLWGPGTWYPDAPPEHGPSVHVREAAAAVSAAL